MLLEGFILIDIASLKALKDMPYTSIDKKSLVDVSKIKSQKTGNICEKVENFLNVVTNPYIIKCGKTIVEIEFSDNIQTIESQTKKYLKSLKAQ